MLPHRAIAHPPWYSRFLPKALGWRARSIASTLDAYNLIITLADHALGEQAWAATPARISRHCNRGGRPPKSPLGSRSLAVSAPQCRYSAAEPVFQRFGHAAQSLKKLKENRFFDEQMFVND
jgi:hypothetical protein